MPSASVPREWRRICVNRTAPVPLRRLAQLHPGPPAHPGDRRREEEEDVISELMYHPSAAMTGTNTLKSQPYGTDPRPQRMEVYQWHLASRFRGTQIPPAGDLVVAKDPVHLPRSTPTELRKYVWRIFRNALGPG